MEVNMIQKIGQIGVPIKNMENAIAFYKDKLGLPLLFSTDSMENSLNVVGKGFFYLSLKKRNLQIQVLLSTFR